jgi:hypothetical protein
MVTDRKMDQDNDVEHLFSWLQTPELRYREFAGAREITDTVVTWQTRANTARAEAERPVPARGNVQLREEYPPDQFPDQGAAHVEIAPVESTVVRDPQMIAPILAPHGEPAPPAPPPASRPSTGGSLLGGAYQEDGAGASTPPAETQPRGERPLDAVFGRLAGRNSLPDPRDRLRHNPDLGPPSGRQR